MIYYIIAKENIVKNLQENGIILTDKIRFCNFYRTCKIPSEKLDFVDDLEQKGLVFYGPSSAGYPDYYTEEKSA